MDNMLERHDLWKDIQNEIENINRPITITEFEFIIKILITREAQKDSMINSIKHLRKNNTNPTKTISEN